MIRLVNQFDSSEHLPSTMVASGGANCSSTTSSCSCIVTAIVASVVSARMVPKLTDASALTPKRALLRATLSAAIFPLIILSSLLILFIEFIHPFFLGLPLLIYIGYLGVISRGSVRPKKFIMLHIVLVVAWLAVSVAEMVAWTTFR